MAKKPKGLPKPKAANTKSSESSYAEVGGLDFNIDKARICPTCGRNGRVVSNRLGVNVHCGPCKRHWPVTNGPLRPETPAALPRGFSKQTMVEPDWNMAFDDLPE